MFILINSSKERYGGRIDSHIVSAADNIELLSMYLEREVREKISSLSSPYNEKALKDFEDIKAGANSSQIEVDEGVYHEVYFNSDGMITLYSTGCPSDDEYAGETMEILEVPDIMAITRFDGAYGFLSNFHLCDLNYEGVNYSSSESAFQAMKESNPDERGNYSHLYPSEAKKKGRSCNLRPDWENAKTEIMYDILKAKFSNEDLKARLLLTGGKELIEGNNWHDNFWGNCTCKKCEAIEGKNMLGKLLMKLRSELQENE